MYLSPLSVDVSSGSVSGTLQSLEVMKKPEDEFDMFALTRGSSLADQRKRQETLIPNPPLRLASLCHVSSTGRCNIRHFPRGSCIFELCNTFSDGFGLYEAQGTLWALDRFFRPIEAGMEYPPLLASGIGSRPVITARSIRWRRSAVEIQR
ncbi:hypothetical protein FKM82_021818 [Ascaphus truei]